MRGKEKKERHTRPAPLPRRRGDTSKDALAWLVSTLALLVALGAVLLGAAVHGELSEQAHDRVPVQVVLAEDVPLVASGGSAEEIPAQVRWTGSDGVERTGLAPVKGPKRAGAVAVVWTTRDGLLVHPPMASAEVAAAAILGSVLAGIVGAMVVAGVAHLARQWTSAVHAAEWEREWARVGPQWTNRAGNSPLE